jgi:hypothetical protein
VGAAFPLQVEFFFSHGFTSAFIHVAKMTLFCVTEHLKLAVLAYCEEEKPNRETSK